MAEQTQDAPALKNDRLLRALLRQPVDRTPVWMMRQAGRYLPEYMKIRAEAGSFMGLATQPELACEVTLQPLRRYPLDAAILFSDILTVPDAMGLGLRFETGEGPKFDRPVRDEAAVKALPTIDPEGQLGAVPLIGFSGSPWTVATYMVEGGSSRNFPTIKRMAYERPDLLHQLLDHLTTATIAYLNAQVAAGAQAIMVFDTWGSVLTPANYRAFSLAYLQRIVDEVTRSAEGRTVPVVLFTKGAGPLLEEMAATGCDALGVDWTTDLATARRYTGDRVALQGNLEPSVLLARPEVIREEVAKVQASYGRGPGHVFNLGHGITPDVDPAHAGAMIEAVVSLSPAYHADD